MDDVCVCWSVRASLDQRVKWDYGVSQLEHICFSEESHNTAPIYNIIKSVPFLVTTLDIIHQALQSVFPPPAGATELR